jgi:hypothetical protein
MRLPAFGRACAEPRLNGSGGLYHDGETGPVDPDVVRTRHAFKRMVAW